MKKHAKNKEESLIKLVIHRYSKESLSNLKLVLNTIKLDVSTKLQ